MFLLYRHFKVATYNIINHIAIKTINFCGDRWKLNFINTRVYGEASTIIKTRTADKCKYGTKIWRQKYHFTWIIFMEILFFRVFFFFDYLNKYKSVPPYFHFDAMIANGKYNCCLHEKKILFSFAESSYRYTSVYETLEKTNVIISAASFLVHCFDMNVADNLDAKTCKQK